MQSVLIVIHILIVIALVAVVLLQRSEGGALGTGGGTGNFMTGRGQANALSRATAVLAALFFATSLLMSIIAGWSRTPHSILGGPGAPASQTAPAPINSGNILDQLKQLQGQSNAPSSPAAPAPAPAAPEQKP
ncbi:MAG: preprotein translocase subunit SecG [Roseiarcus sp.]|jgi:preprotein translocase subunit SecG|uniref:preprotein translocase subunit SecG n=1 Tax=Roseiarcus sp. TaxID=1969460 RepID=UPI003BAEF640